MDENISKFGEIPSNENQASGQVGKIFNAIDAHLSTELVDKTDAIYQFNLKGNLSL